MTMTYVDLEQFFHWLERNEALGYSDLRMSKLIQAYILYKKQQAGDWHEAAIESDYDVLEVHKLIISNGPMYGKHEWHLCSCGSAFNHKYAAEQHLRQVNFR